MEFYSKTECDEFQRQVRLSKDRLVQQAAPMTGMSSNTNNVNIADDLEKLSELLSQGSITQDEYDKVKADLLRQQFHR